VSQTYPIYLDVKLEGNTAELEAVVVKASPFVQPVESVNSLHTLRGREIVGQAGAKSDISRAMQALPGVSAQSAFSNGLVIRGGPAYENSFYLDGIKLPVINHFEGMNSSSGSIGILHPEFLSEVSYNSGSFPAKRGDALSSIIQFKQRNGRNDRAGFHVAPSVTDARLVLEGPIARKTTYLLGVRRSLSNAIFKIYGFPHLPIYTDAQFKVNTVLNSKNEIYLTGIIADDYTQINEKANKTLEQRFFLNQVPQMQQRNYAVGLGYKRYRKNGYSNLIISRNLNRNHFKKYFQSNQTSPENLLLDFQTLNTENTLRLEDVQFLGDYKLSVGSELSLVEFESSTYKKVSENYTEAANFNSAIGFKKYGIFAQVSRRWWQERLSFSFGIRLEGNDLKLGENRKFSGISPRFSWSIAASEKIKLNFGTGIYYQTPPLVLLAFQKEEQLNNKLSLMRSHHITGGAEWNDKKVLRITLEGYFKKYTDYPFQLNDKVAWHNQSSIAGFTGNEPATSTANGNSYGLELMIHRRISRGWKGMFAYTLAKSTFSDKNRQQVPSAYDSRHTLNLSLNRAFKNDWNLSLGYNYQSPLAYTPYADASNYLTTWLVYGNGVKNYNLLSTQRGRSQHILNIRIEKKVKIAKFEVTLFGDIRNVLGNKTGEKALVADIDWDEEGSPDFQKAIINPDAPLQEQRVRYNELDGFYGKPIPTVGFSFGK